MVNLASIGTQSIRVLLIVEQRHAEGRSSTVRGIADDAGIAPSVCHHHLTRLRAAGLIDWDPSATASIHPLVTVVAAG